jgi:hypothetical protein
MNRKSSLSIGTVIDMTDGWRGRIESVSGGIVACLAIGAKADPNWNGDYRLLGPSAVRMVGTKAIATWATRPATTRRRSAMSAADLEKGLSDFRAELRRSRLDREWDSAPLQ